MRTWFNPKQVMNDCAEGHAFLIGAGDGFTFQRTDWHSIHQWSLPKEVKGELHYYKWGAMVGRLAFILLTTGMLALLIRGC